MFYTSGFVDLVMLAQVACLPVFHPITNVEQLTVFNRCKLFLNKAFVVIVHTTTTSECDEGKAGMMYLQVILCDPCLSTLRLFVV